MAGPLSGLVFAVPALFIGLRYSHVVAASQAPTVLGLGGVSVNSSVLMAVLAHISLGTSVLNNDHLVLGPLAFAGWLGLIVTALNLLPIGQLDGGHMSHAMFGSRRARSISIVGMVCLFLLALFVWPGLMLWAIIVLHRRSPRCASRKRFDADGRWPHGPGLFLVSTLGADHRAGTPGVLRSHRSSFSLSVKILYGCWDRLVSLREGVSLARLLTL
jgi:hypothetical protein